MLAASAVALACIALHVLGLPLGVLLASAVAATAAGLVAARGRRRRHRSALDADVVTFCFAMAGEVRAGRMPAEALAATLPVLGPLAGEMSAVARAVANGAPIDLELSALAETLTSQRLRTVAAVWSAATATGSRAAEVLERVAAAFTAEDEAVADLEAVAAGPRATAAVLTSLPAVGMLLAASVGAHPLALLLHTTAGGLLLAGATVLDASGLWWVRAVTQRALRA